MNRIYTEEYKNKRFQNLLDEGFDILTSAAIVSTETKDKKLEVEVRMGFGVSFLIQRL